MSPKTPKTLRAIHANRGVEAKYRKALQRMIAEMHGSVEYWLTAAYRKDPPRMLALVEQAQDAAPSAKMKKVLDELARRWIAAGAGCDADIQAEPPGPGAPAP